MTPEKLLGDMFAAALQAADPFQAVPQNLPEKPKGKIVVVGAGKASGRMAQAVESVWGPCEGLVIVPHGASLPCQGIEIVEARHPVPDQAGEDATKRIIAMLSDLGKDDLALCLISGGGSSLLSAPLQGLTLADKQLLNKILLVSGAAIGEMNIVRKHLSAVKGGRLAVSAYPAKIVTLTISDVPGDDPAIIASGPTVPDPTTIEDALKVISQNGIDLPRHILQVLQSPLAETPDASHPVFANAETHLVATPQMALEAAAKVARAAGVTPVILGDAIEGEAREAGKVMAGIARQIRHHNQPAPAPAVLISGGETTVSITSSPGKGGRCTEFLLGYALAAWDLTGTSALACDTDGRDGSEQNAGAIWLEKHRAIANKDSARTHLNGHDAYSFFEHLGGLIQTGPTHTNVNDFRAIYLEATPEDFKEPGE